MKIFRNKIIIFAIIFLSFLSILFLILNQKPKTQLFFNVDYSLDAVQHKKDESHFVEWWYFDGMINDNFSYVLTFWISQSMGNWIELTIYDKKNDITKVYNEKFSNEATITSKNKCHIEMGHNSVIENDGIYFINVAVDKISFNFTLTPQINGFGLYAKNFLNTVSSWVWVVPVPRGTAKGTIKYNEKTMEFFNVGYHDHNYFPSNSFTNFEPWYWGRFFTEHFTIILTKRPTLKRSSIIVFKNDALFTYAWNKKDNFFDSSNLNDVIKRKVPKKIDFKFNNIFISIENNYVSRQTENYSRFINNMTVSILNRNQNYLEKGTGLSEFVYKQ